MTKNYVLQNINLGGEISKYKDIIQTIDETLNTIIKRYSLPPVVSLAFSAGVDSTTIAYKLLKLGFKVKLFTIGSKLSKDEPFAKSFIKKLTKQPKYSKQVTLNYIELTKNDVLNAKDEIYTLLKNKTPKDIIKLAHASRFKYPGLETYPNAMDIAIGICMQAIATHSDVTEYILTGHGAGDIFAGGFLATQLTKNKLTNYVNEKSINLGKIDLVRDSLIFKSYNKTMLSPLLEPEFVKLAKTIPLELKLKRLDDNTLGAGPIIRKYIWVLYSLWLGVPKEFALRPPKSMQYSCGIYRWLNKRPVYEG